MNDIIENQSDDVVPFMDQEDFNLWILLDHARVSLYRLRDIELSQYDLTPEQAGILHALITIGSAATIYEIANYIIRQRHSVSTLINRMAKRGLVKKVKSPKSKKFYFRITQKGLDTYKKVSITLIIMVFKAIPAEDKQKLALYLKLLTNEALSMLGSYTVSASERFKNLR